MAFREREAALRRSQHAQREEREERKERSRKKEEEWKRGDERESRRERDTATDTDMRVYRAIRSQVVVPTRDGDAAAERRVMQGGWGGCFLAL